MKIDVQAILDKIYNTPIPEVKKVAVAFSGGLDSCLAIELLRRVYKAQEIVPITIDVGQGEQELNEVHAKAKLLGITPIIIDAKKEFSDIWLTQAIQANSNYNGYPVSTSMTRQLVARIVALEAMKLGCDAILEGSTGKGNDQYRMHIVFKSFAPQLEILVPVRDFDLTRTEEVALCVHWNIPVTEQITGGDDKTMWCRSIASGAVGLNQQIPDDVWLWLVPSLKASDKAITVTITFKEGIPVVLDGKDMPLDQLVAHLNTIAGAHGIGLIDMFEDGIMGLKSREIYEAPAATVILNCHKDLEAASLSKEEIQFKKIVDAQWAYLVYHGLWYHPLKEALDAFIKTTQHYVNGTYTIMLYKGTMTITNRSLPTSLFFPEVRSITSKAFNQQWCTNAAKIMGLPFELMAKRKQKEM